MFAILKKARPPAEDAPAAAPSAPAAAGQPEVQAIVTRISHEASALGKEAAEVRGAIDDLNKVMTAQAQALHALAGDLGVVVGAQDAIGTETQGSVKAVARAREAVEKVGGEVAGIVDTLRKVSEAAGQITQIALQTRLVAFNASVEAKRAGEAGRGFGVVADAVKDLAAKVEVSSKEIMGTVGNLDARIGALAREIERKREGQAGDQGAVHRALGEVEQAVARIEGAAGKSRQDCAALNSRMGDIEGHMRTGTQTLDATLRRTETFLKVSEQLIEITADCGVVTEDTPYIRAAQELAAQASKFFEDALRTGAISEADLFDERYVPIAGSNPPQHTARFCALTDRVLPQVQERFLGMTDKVVFAIAVDRNGYVPTHNTKYCHPQRPGDVLWNTANSRYRRVFNDRTGLASARNKRPFLLQTYRRDMGGGNFVVVKEASAPIVVNGKHWGGTRIGFRF